MRCVNEASLFKNNCFVTLTYDDNNIPANGSIDVAEIQLFMKRLRKKFSGVECVVNSAGKDSYPIRYFHCGEYGEALKRPHYHVLFFNFDFFDKFYWSTKNGSKLYRSPALEVLWPYGMSTIGDVTFESAAYVSGYIMKKINGDMAESHYKGLKPEYVTMSRRPGIGYRWFQKYKDEIKNFDSVVVRGREVKPAKYYDRLLEVEDVEAYNRNKLARRPVDLGVMLDNINDRLVVKEVVAKAGASQYTRDMEAL
ncbi:MAG: replication initiator protein [Microviridae sp.]|nr:MAG: replication initiator protein [Microviridae sp.]